MENTRRRRIPVSAEAIARLADAGKDVSRFFTNKGRVMGPIQRVNVDLASGMLEELNKNQTGPLTPSLHRARTFHSSMALEDWDRALILETLEQAGWIVGGPRGAAGKLGLKRTTLLAKMKRLGISRPIPQEGTDVFGVAREDTQI
jgi:transcriptional regulator with GAF, ATPase, and Fis domain